MSHAMDHAGSSKFRIWIATAALAAAMLAFCQTGSAQQSSGVIRSEAELEDLVGPIALYPDDLVAIVLPASTYPVQIVQAARLLEERKSDPTLEPDEDWDSSIVALLNYPEVLQLMNDDLDWTWELGEAVLDQQEDVLAAVQDFRNEAYAAGNLKSDDRQVVTTEDDAIEIAPADPEVVYIPYYEPSRVIVRQPSPVFFYYSTGYPLYYYPYPVGYVFPTGYFWGVASWFSIGWHTHYVHVYDYTYYGHPYYRRTYYRPYYHHGGIDTIVNVNVNVNRSNHAWQPTYRRGARPYTNGTHYRADPGRERFVTERTARNSRVRDGSGGTRNPSAPDRRYGTGSRDPSTRTRESGPRDPNDRTRYPGSRTGGAGTSTTPRTRTQPRTNGGVPGGTLGGVAGNSHRNTNPNGTRDNNGRFAPSTRAPREATNQPRTVTPPAFAAPRGANRARPAPPARSASPTQRSTPTTRIAPPTSRIAPPASRSSSAPGSASRSASGNGRSRSSRGTTSTAPRAVAPSSNHASRSSNRSTSSPSNSRSSSRGDYRGSGSSARRSRR